MTASALPLSPIKRIYYRNPLWNDGLSNNVHVYKAAKGLLVMRLGAKVIKWSNDQKAMQEFKIHCDDVGHLKFVIPILYGRTSDSFTLPSLFGKTILPSNKIYFEKLRKQINQTAQQKVIGEAFDLVGKSDRHTIMIYPKMDGTLLDLIPLLRFHKRNDLIDKINRFVESAIETISSRGVMHGDLRPRNVFFNISQNEIEIFLGDFGKATRVPNSQFLKPEIGAFKSAIYSIKAARKVPSTISKDINWQKLQLKEDRDPLISPKRELSPEESSTNASKRRK